MYMTWSHMGSQSWLRGLVPWGLGIPNSQVLLCFRIPFVVCCASQLAIDSLLSICRTGMSPLDELRRIWRQDASSSKLVCCDRRREIVHSAPLIRTARRGSIDLGTTGVGIQALDLGDDDGSSFHLVDRHFQCLLGAQTRYVAVSHVWHPTISRLQCRGGVGALVRDGVIVGRMIWAVPSCPCSMLASVRLKMPRLPKRRPLPLGR